MVYILPSLYDPDGGSASITSIDLTQVSSFVTKDGNSIVINPSSSQSSGSYTIKITVQDDGEIP